MSFVCALHHLVGYFLIMISDVSFTFARVHHKGWNESLILMYSLVHILCFRSITILFLKTYSI